MDNLTRLQYLEAMGIDVWVSRRRVETEEIPFVDQADFLLDEQPGNSFASEPVKWTALQKQVVECQLCELCKTRKNTVFGAGNVTADWMLIGEAPGQNEDLEGKPFVGPAGKLLAEMIRAIGLERDAVYIANIIKCRPPNNRDPKVEEINHCRQYLQQQVSLVKPKIILAVGRVAAQALLETNEPLSKLRGTAHSFAGIPLVIVYHPAYLLRSLLEKRKAWHDLQLALNEMKKNNTK